MDDYEIIKKAVEQAKISSASIAGEIKGKLSNLQELGITGENIIDAGNKYLDQQEPALDKQKKALDVMKQKIISKYSEIIKTTSPGL